MPRTGKRGASPESRPGTSGGGGSDPSLAGRRRPKPSTMLESVHLHALERADYKEPKGGHKGKHGHGDHHGHEHYHGVSDEMVARKVHQLSVDDAREMAFQAQEQMRSLQEVKMRVKNTMVKAKDLDLDEISKQPAQQVKQADMKRWVADSRRHINGSIFRYNESCEERNQELSGFCNWFELYENLWPLPLVANDLQYDKLLAKLDDDVNPEADEAEEGFDAVQMLWPQIHKQRDDLGKIMSVTSSMGQKALNAELRDQLKKLSNEAASKQIRIDDLEKKLKAEIDSSKAKDQEAIKARQMHEVQIRRRDEEIKQLGVDMEKLREKHVKDMETAKQMHQIELDKMQQRMDEAKRIADEEIAFLKKTIEKQREEAAAMEARIVEWKEKYAEKENECQMLEKELARQKQELKIMRIQLEQVMAELAAEREAPYVKKLEAQIEDFKSKISLLESQLENAQAEIEEKKAEIKQLKKELREAREKIRGLEEDVARRIKVEAELQNKVKDLLHQLESANKRIEQLNTDVNRLEAVVKAKEAIIAEKEQQMADMNTAFAGERSKYEGEKDELRGEIEDWKNKLDESVQMVVDEQNKVKALQGQLEEAEKRTAEADLKGQRLQERLDNIDSEHQKIIGEILAREDALKESMAEVQETLDRERTSFAEMMEEERAATKKVMDEMNEHIGELEAFKAEVESHTYVDLHTQTDEAWFGGGEGGGGGGGASGNFGGEVMRKRFESLRDRMLDLKGEYEKQMKDFKVSILRAIEERSAWQKELDVLSSDMTQHVAKAEAGLLAAKVKLQEEGHGDVTEDVLLMCRHAKKLLSGAAQMKGSEFEADGSHVVGVVDHVPTALYEIERILDGIDGFFDSTITPPGSAPSSRPSSAKIKHLRPLLAKASNSGELQIAEAGYDFSKLGHLKPIGAEMPQRRPAPRPSSAHRSQDESFGMAAQSSLGAVPAWHQRQDVGPAFGLAHPQEEASFSYSTSPGKSQLNASVRSFAEASQSPKVPTNNFSPFNPSPVIPPPSPSASTRGQPPPPTPPRADTAMSQAATPGQTRHATPQTTMTRAKPLSARGSVEIGADLPSLQAPVRGRSSHGTRGSLTDRAGTPKGKSSWRKLTDDAPPEIAPKVGTQWAGDAAGGLSGFPVTSASSKGRSGSPGGRFLGSASPPRSASPERGVGGVVWEHSHPLPATKQRWESPPGRSQSPSDLAQDILNSAMRGGPSNVGPGARGGASAAGAGQRSRSPVREDVLAGSREGLRPGKVLRGGAQVERGSGHSGLPLANERPMELMTRR